MFGLSKKKKEDESSKVLERVNRAEILIEEEKLKVRLVYQRKLEAFEAFKQCLKNCLNPNGNGVIKKDENKENEA